MHGQKKTVGNCVEMLMVAVLLSTLSTEGEDHPLLLACSHEMTLYLEFLRGCDPL